MLFPLYDLNPHTRWPVITLLLIAINFGVTVYTRTLPEREQQRVAMEYGFVPARLSHAGDGRVIEAPLEGIDRASRKVVRVGTVQLSTKTTDVYRTFLTTMFLHGGWGHLIMNMWTLWVFGNNIEDRLGSFVYLMFYLLGGIVATLVFWATGPNGLTPVIGASGAVAAVLGAYSVTYPWAKVRTLVFVVLVFFIDIPALVLLGIWFALQVFSGLAGLWGVAMEPVAFWAHVGGFVAGMVMMPLLALGTPPPGTNWRQEAREMFEFE